MTNQEAFDTVWDYFVVQENPRSVDEDNTCQYRGNDGTKCAIGCLIPNSMYLEEMEDTASVPGLLRKYPQVKELLSGVYISLLSQLQIAHDEASNQTAEQGDDRLFLPQVKDNLILVAEAYSLVVPV